VNPSCPDRSSEGDAEPRGGAGGDVAPMALDLVGPAAPPRRNGELAFDHPWQGRMFGITMALGERGVLPYELFRRRLIAEIGRWEASHPDGVEYRYWDHWAAALQEVLAELGLVEAALMYERAALLAARPSGHDHGSHRHDHGSHGP
jgi:nitrile hydratase accessory protein